MDQRAMAGKARRHRWHLRPYLEERREIIRPANFLAFGSSLSVRVEL